MLHSPFTPPSPGLYSLKWDGWGIAPSVWTVVMMAISGIIAATIPLQGGFANELQRRDPAYVLVIVWALVAIPLQGGFANAIRQANTPLIAMTGWGLAIALTVLNFANELKPRSKTTTNN